MWGPIVVPLDNEEVLDLPLPPSPTVSGPCLSDFEILPGALSSTPETISLCRSSTTWSSSRVDLLSYWFGVRGGRTVPEGTGVGRSSVSFLQGTTPGIYTPLFYHPSPRRLHLDFVSWVFRTKIPVGLSRRRKSSVETS